MAEHPHGKLPDITEPRSRDLTITFMADDIGQARKKARSIYDEFCAKLPKEKLSGLSGVRNLKVSDPTFAKVHAL